MTSVRGQPAPRRRRGRLAMLLTLCVTLVLLVLLGSWQVQRLGWKRNLIAQVEARVHAAAVAAVPAAIWPALDVEAEAYRRVRLDGRLLLDRRLFVYAATDLGAGYWVMVPMQLVGEPVAVVWVNLGYVTNAQRHQLDAEASPGSSGRSAEAQSTEPMSVTGLLRPGEHARFFLRDNVPAEQRWYLRVPAQMSAATGLATASGATTAPFFVDADPGLDPQAIAQGGLTRVHFSDNHLVYALTWYGLALLNLALLVWLVRTEWLPRRVPLLPSA